MNIENDWTDIRHLFARARYASIATVDPEGRPHVTPIGSLVLDRAPGRGFWFEIFTRSMPGHLERDARLCAMAVDTRLSFWSRALLAGRFPTAPGIRLVGVAGARREPTEQEVEWFQRRVRPVRWTRGHDLLWKEFRWGREVAFEEVLPIRLGKMWPGRRTPEAA